MLLAPEPMKNICDSKLQMASDPDRSSLMEMTGSRVHTLPSSVYEYTSGQWPEQEDGTA